MSLRLSLLPGPALIQADLDYQKEDVDQKIEQYVGTSEDPSAELDKAFIMSIEIGSVRLFSCLFKLYKVFISNFRCDNVHKKGLLFTMVFGIVILTHGTIVLVCR